MFVFTVYKVYGNTIPITWIQNSNAKYLTIQTVHVFDEPSFTYDTFLKCGLSLNKY